jgi:NTP pyrophosphatase (non-canonical NTP hydrolase)
VSAEDLIPGSALDTALNMVLREYEKAARQWPAMQSAHEGYAVILEELDELWDEVKAQRLGLMRDEAVQVAAMAMRFVIDVCLPLYGVPAEVAP